MVNAKRRVFISHVLVFDPSRMLVEREGCNGDDVGCCEVFILRFFLLADGVEARDIAASDAVPAFADIISVGKFGFRGNYVSDNAHFAYQHALRRTWLGALAVLVPVSLRDLATVLTGRQLRPERRACRSIAMGKCPVILGYMLPSGRQLTYFWLEKFSNMYLG